jgi:hypothetical protein
VPAFTAAVAVATAANPVVSTAFLAMTPGMQMAVEDIINQYIEDKDPSTLKQRLQILKKYLTAKQIKELAKMIIGVGAVAGAGTKIGDQKFSINEVIKTLGGKKVKAKVADDKFSINEAIKVVKGKGVRGRPRTRGLTHTMPDGTHMLDSEHSGGKIHLDDVGGAGILEDIEKAFKKVGKTIDKKVIKPAGKVVKTIDKEVIKPAGKYITAKKGGLASDLIDYGIPAATAAIVGGIAGAATGGVGGVVGSAAGSKLGKEIIAPAVRKATGAGMLGGEKGMRRPVETATMGAGCGCGGALMPAGYDGEGLMPAGMGLMPAGMGLMPAGMGLKPAGAGVYMPAGRTIVRHGKGVSVRVMVPKKITVSGGAMMPKTSSAGTGDYVPLMIDTPAFYTPMM